LNILKGAILIDGIKIVPFFFVSFQGTAHLNKARKSGGVDLYFF
jgi:hypothetical protein